MKKLGQALNKFANGVAWVSFVGVAFLLLMGLLPWLLRVAGVVLLIKALLDKPTRWENFMPAVVAFALSLLIGWIF